MSQYLWYNEGIPVDDATLHFLKFSEKSINYVSQLFSDNDCSIKKWHEFKEEYNLHLSSYFQWLQSIDSILEKWKFFIKENYKNAINLIIHVHHLIKGSRVITLDKLTSTGIYSILISEVQNKPSSNIYFKNLYNKYNTDWPPIYILPRLVTYILPRLATYILPRLVTYIPPRLVTYILPRPVTYILPRLVTYILPRLVTYILPRLVTYIPPRLVTYIPPRPVTYILPRLVTYILPRDLFNAKC